MNILNFVYYFCLFTLSFIAGAETQKAQRFPDEDYIPFYAELTQSYATDQGVLKKGTRAVVLRPVGATQLKVSISRLGTFTLPAMVTDVHEEIERLQDSTDPNLRTVPRMSFFLANRIMSGESGWQDPVRSEVINATSRWLLLYGDASHPETSAAVVAASKFYDNLLPEERAKTVFVFMDIRGDKQAIAKLAATTRPSIQSMPGYLSKGYSKSLDHLDLNQAFPQLVEVASSGRIIHHAKSPEAVRAWLESGTAQ